MRFGSVLRLIVCVVFALLGFWGLHLQSQPVDFSQFREEFGTALQPLTDYRLKTLLQRLVEVKLRELVSEGAAKQMEVEALKHEQQLLLNKPQSDDNSIKSALSELAALDQKIQAAEAEYESLHALWNKRRAVAKKYNFSVGVNDFHQAIDLYRSSLKAAPSKGAASLLSGKFYSALRFC